MISKKNLIYTIIAFVAGFLVTFFIIKSLK
ncbi:hypothetical protein IWX84_000432 [Flavobacterium sp. CG_9.10]|nr:hypothetical protein [Flavobacterium sp. CG_9.10]